MVMLWRCLYYMVNNKTIILGLFWGIKYIEIVGKIMLIGYCNKLSERINYSISYNKIALE